MYTIQMPSRIACGSDALDHLPSFLEGFHRICLFSDEGIQKCGAVEQVEAVCRKAGKQLRRVILPCGEPTVQMARNAIDAFMREKDEAIVAVGGGAVMDVAKLASLFTLNTPYTLEDLAENAQSAQKNTYTVLIPTTAGTGAEATANAILTFPEKQLKVGIVSKSMICDAVILDPAMTASAPRMVAAAACIDALAHAIECYTSARATPLSDLYAARAVGLILEFGEEGCCGSSAKAREMLLLAAFWAGCAIAGSGTTAVHALSYPLGGRFHVPHGVANAILLLPVMRFNEPACREKLAALHDQLRPACFALSSEEKSAWVLNRMAQLIRAVGIPETLDAFGVSKEHLDWLVASGMQVTRLLQNNPRKMEAVDARDIYLQILS